MRFTYLKIISRNIPREFKKMVKWTVEEKTYIMYLYDIYGNKYSLFSQYFFPWRTPGQIKSQVKHLLKMRKK